MGDEATKDFEESFKEEERLRRVREEEGEGGDSVGPAKDPLGGVVKEKISGLSAVRKAVKNGDMFSEDLFGEKLLVRCDT